MKGEAKLLRKHKEAFEEVLSANIPYFGMKTSLRDAVEYALLNGGKRIRPIIVKMVSEGIGNGFKVDEAASSVEFFHVASLIADDLPCMDDEDTRRNKPTVHKVFGETTALLSSYALLTSGFEKIYGSVRELESNQSPYAGKACEIALKHASRCSGIWGATGGQFLDIYPPDSSLETIKEIVQKKTVTLFEVSFIFGWIFGGGDPQHLDLVKKAAYHFGMSFQISDDLSDIEQDKKNDCKVNIAIALGEEMAYQMFLEEIDKFTVYLKALNLFTPAFEELKSLVELNTPKPSCSTI